MISVQDNDRYNKGWFTVNNVYARKSGDFCTKHRCFWEQGIIVVATGIGIGNGDSGNSGCDEESSHRCSWCTNLLWRCSGNLVSRGHGFNATRGHGFNDMIFSSNKNYVKSYIKVTKKDIWDIV